MKKVNQPGIILGVCSMVLACTACSQSTMDQPAGDSGQQDHAENTPMIEQGTSWTPQISDAIEDLARRTGISSDAITVDKALSVIWGSSALGCPEPGMSYTEAYVPGLRLLLKADDAIYLYHGRNGAELFFCPPDRARQPAYGRGEEIM